ncbi:Metalloreductase STEAP1 [Armadillidium vulgare]|nr:Metalloreductase STEAP1 [Armadillidium vulgare]
MKKQYSGFEGLSPVNIHNDHDPGSSYITLDQPSKTIAIVGSGDLGLALTVCFVRAGYRVVIGSRNPEKNRHKINAVGGEISNLQYAMKQSSIVVPLGSKYKKKCLAAKLQKCLPKSHVVKAFNTLSAYALLKGLTQGSKEVPICSNNEEARNTIINLARNLGFTPVDFGPLSNAKKIEDIPLEFFPEWKLTLILGVCIWIFAFIFQLFRRQLCPNFENLNDDEEWNWRLFDSLPVTTITHTDGLTALTLLTSCYCPGVIASYLQLIRGTKYSKFPKWLDNWLKARKNMGLLALFFAVSHFILAIVQEIGYGGYNMDWNHCLYFFCGDCAIILMLVLGVTSLPSVSSSLTWREFYSSTDI